MAEEHKLADLPCVFVVDVKFRRNATWQGTIATTAKNGDNLTVSFRSALEMIKIMDSALEEKLSDG